MAETPGAPGSIADRVRSLVGVFWREVAKFGTIGIVGLIIDVGLFNVLLLTVMTGHPTTAKIISGTIATGWAWMGNRLWTFRHRRNRPAHHEAALFFLVNGVGLAISTGYLAFTTYALGFGSHLALNVNNFIGIGLATLMRFWAYRRYVFAGEIVGDEETAVPAEPLPQKPADHPA